jgi:hypothetical protein
MEFIDPGAANDGFFFVFAEAISDRFGWSKERASGVLIDVGIRRLFDDCSAVETKTRETCRHQIVSYQLHP